MNIPANVSSRGSNLFLCFEQAFIFSRSTSGGKFELS